MAAGRYPPELSGIARFIEGAAEEYPGWACNVRAVLKLHLMRWGLSRVMDDLIENVSRTHQEPDSKKGVEHQGEWREAGNEAE